MLHTLKQGLFFCFLYIVSSKNALAAIIDGGPADSGGSNSITNPLASDDIIDFFLNILDILLTFAIPIIVLFIMYAGFLYVTAQGDESKIKRAHSALTWAVVGGVIILGAELIITVIQNTVDTL